MEAMIILLPFLVICLICREVVRSNRFLPDGGDIDYVLSKIVINIFPFLDWDFRKHPSIETNSGSSLYKSKSADVIKVFEIYRTYMIHESNLINNRMTWLLAINGFLFASVGIVYQKNLDLLNKSLDSKPTNPIMSIEIQQTIVAITHFLELICFTGILVGFMTFTSILGAKTVGRALKYHFSNSYAFSVDKSTQTEYVSIGGTLRIPTISGAGLPSKYVVGNKISTYLPLWFTVIWYVALLIIYDQ